VASGEWKADVILSEPPCHPERASLSSWAKRRIYFPGGGGPPCRYRRPLPIL